MRNIYAIGETVLDIIFKNNQPVAAKPGGSMLNSVVTLGRLNAPAFFISEYGIDQVGNLIDTFLSDNNVDTRYVYRLNEGKTPLALAFLDGNNNAAYDFYKIFPSKRLDIGLPHFNENDFLLFGSFFSISPEVRGYLMKLLIKARESGCIIIYDPNFRAAHLPELDKLKPLILENFTFADIVRGSDEDFKHIFDLNSPAEVFRQLPKNVKVLVYTANSKGVNIEMTGFRKHYQVKNIEPVSTIGAGDNFNSGIIYSLFKLEIMKKALSGISSETWDKIINTGILFATEVCMGYENYIPEKFARGFRI